MPSWSADTRISVVLLWLKDIEVRCYGIDASYDAGPAPQHEPLDGRGHSACIGVQANLQTTTLGPADGRKEAFFEKQGPPRCIYGRACCIHQPGQ